MSDTDVLVIGGGPAGSAAAITCAEAGLRVTLLERERFPRLVPGETLHPGVEALFVRLGVAEAVRAAKFPRHEGHWVRWGRACAFSRFGDDAEGPWQGFQAWRPTLDAIMLERARSLGVAIRQSCTVYHPMLRGSRVVGLVTADGAMTAALTIDASGSAHWMARQLTLPVVRVSRRLVAWYGYAVGGCRHRIRAPALVAEPSGWTWTARVRRGIYQWTRLSFDAWRPRVGWLPPDLRGTRVHIARRGADVTWRIVTPSAGPGFFLVGDAGAVLDPTSSHGVLRALMSGMMAGRLARATVRDGEGKRQVAGAYHAWLSNWFHHDVVRLRDTYARIGLAVT